MGLLKSDGNQHATEEELIMFTRIDLKLSECCCIGKENWKLQAETWKHENGKIQQKGEMKNYKLMS